MKQLVKTLTLFGCMLTSIALHGQDKTYPVKTTAKPNDLKTYKVNEETGEINLLFSKPGKKYEVFTNYVFDKNLNLVTETEEELDTENVKKSTFWKELMWGPEWARKGNGIIQDSVLSVESNMIGGLVLLNGYIGYKTTETADWVHYYEGFIYREKIPIKDEATGRRLILLASQTDAVVGVYSTFKTHGNLTRVASSGDVLAVSCINTVGTKDPATGEKIFGANIRFLAQNFSAKTLGKTAETPFEFKYSYTKQYNQTATDGSNDMLLIFAPTHGGVKPYFAPDKNEYEFIRIGKDTKVKERVKFNSPYGRLNNLHIYNFDDETVIFGTSKTGNESKYADFVPFKGNDDEVVVIRIKAGQEPIVKTTSIKSLSGPIVNFAANDAIKTADNQVWITGQLYSQKGSDPAIWSNIYAFSIAPDGSIAKHLVLPQVEKRSEQAAAPIQFTKLHDGSLLWTTYEYVKKGMYPKYAKITNGQLGAVVFPGDKKYVVNGKFPLYISPNATELIYFGNTEDNKQFWLHKVGF